MPYASVCTLIRTNAIVFALAIALAVPTLVGAVWYTKLLQTNETKAQLTANYLEALLASDSRQIASTGLREIAAAATWRRDDATRVRVLTADNEPVHEWGPPAESLSVVARSPIVVRGQAVGAVETSTGAATLLYTMLVLVVLNSVVAAVAYLGVTKTPIQALHEVAEKLAEHEHRLAEKNTQLDAALVNMVQGLCLLDADQRVVVANRRYAEIYGLAPQEIAPGTPLSAILEARVRRGVHGQADGAEPVELAIARTRQEESSITSLPDGRFISILGRPLPNGGTISTHEDVTDRKKAEARIAYMAMHDALTGLPNRRHFESELARVGQHTSAERSFAVLCLDLDQFKPVNDTLGHLVGDKLLRAVAKRLAASVRESDVVARLGGDEFAILQTDVAGPEQPAILAKRLVAYLAEPFEIDGHRITIGTSLGVAMAGDGADGMELLRNADLALYASKGEGRGCYRFFEEQMHARVQERHGLERDLRSALGAGQFELYYQPLVDLRTGAISAFEALLRWNHPARGRVSPADFIPVAEEMSLIGPIGSWVLETACREAVKWPRDVRVTVNLSAHQFKSDALALEVAAALSASGLPPDRLEIEITETALLQNSDHTIETLKQLSALGVHISMDDFGIGYSSLNYLRAFPFDKIKIDKCFVQDPSEGSHSARILRAVIGLAESLGMRTTVEGVETAEQLERLRIEGCTEVQGYYFSPPRPASEVPRMLHSVPAKLVA
jgi:diguanylate cyclase (GGDEF)-like protein